MTVTMTTAWAFLMAHTGMSEKLRVALCNLYTRDEPDLSTIRNRPEFNSSTFYFVPSTKKHTPFIKDLAILGTI